VIDARQIISFFLNLIFFSAFALSLDGVHAHLFVILLQSCQVLTGLGEFTFLHPLSHVPVDEGSLGVHQVELVVQPGPSLGNRGRIGQHAHGTLDLGQISSWHDGRGLVVDPDFEPSGTPVHELNGPLGLDGGNGRVHILWNDIPSVQHAASHVLPMTRIALDHLICWLEASIGNFRHGQLLMISLLRRDDGCVGDEREMNPGVWDQVGLELGQVYVQGTVESERRRDGGHDLTDEPVQIGVGGTLNVQVPSANVVDGLIVDHEGTVRVLQRGVGREDRVVRLDHGRGHLGRWVDGKLELGLLAIVDREAFHEEGGEPGPSAPSEGVEDEEALKTRALVSQLADPVEDQVHYFLPNGVVTTGVVVGRILLPRDELLRVEELAVGAGSDLVNDGRLQIDKDSPRDMLPCPRLAEEGVEGVITHPHGLVRGHLTVRLNPMLQAVQFPTRVSDLDSGLADVD